MDSIPILLVNYTHDKKGYIKSEKERPELKEPKASTVNQRLVVVAAIF